MISEQRVLAGVHKWGNWLLISFELPRTKAVVLRRDSSWFLLARGGLMSYLRFDPRGPENTPFWTREYAIFQD